MPAKSIPVIPAARPRSACVIGAGLGGLALAIRLQARGIATTVIEAQPNVGGMIRRREHSGFAFEEGPGELGDLAPWRELAALAGTDLAQFVTLREITPACRYYWRDGTSFDLDADPTEQVRQLGQLAPYDIAGFQDLQHWFTAARTDAWQRLAEAPEGGIVQKLRSVPAALRNQGWRSASGLVAHLIENERLREVLAMPALLSGANPFTASALNLLGQAGPGRSAWWPQGGMSALIGALVARFEALGGTVRLDDRVVELELIGNRIDEAVTHSGWRGRFDLFASNTDVIHTYRDLLRHSPRAGPMAARLARRRFAPAAFTVHFAVTGSWPGVPHRTVLFGPRFKEWLGDIFGAGVLPQDSLILLHHPSVTDPTLAPAGTSLFRATILVPHLGKLPIDWDALAPQIARRVLDEIGRRLIPDIHDRIVAQTVTTPRDLTRDLGAHLGSGWSLEATAFQAALVRPPQRDPGLTNFYLVGAATHPGAGVAAVLAGAKAAATLIHRELL